VVATPSTALGPVSVVFSLELVVTGLFLEISGSAVAAVAQSSAEEPPAGPRGDRRDGDDRQEGSWSKSHSLSSR